MSTPMVAKLDAIFGGESKSLDSSDSKVIEETAAAAFQSETPVEFDWFNRTESTQPRTDDIAHVLMGAGWNQTAWALAQLHYDQVFKQSILEGSARNLGHPLFGIARVAFALGHRAAARHYAALAIIGDVLFHGPDFRGAAPHMLANLSDSSNVDRLLIKAREHAEKWPKGTPVCPEAILAATWFPTRAGVIVDLGVANRGIPFIERLLGTAEAAEPSKAGVLFESAGALLLSTTPGFEVRGGFEDVSSQTDIVMTYKRDAFSSAPFPDGYAIAECKHWKTSVDARVVREFGARCFLQDVALGILVSKKGITGSDDVEVALRDAERERRRFLERRVHILVASAQQLRDKPRELRCLEPLLIADFERLRFGKLS